MFGRSPLENNDWTALWGDAQHKYWQAWQDMLRPTPPPQNTAHPWLNGFDSWSKLMVGTMPSEYKQWAEKLVDVNKSYLHMAENVWRALAVPTSSHSPEAWREAVMRSLTQMQEAFTSGLGAGGLGAAKDPWAGFAALWGMPMDNWRRAYSACSTLPGDVEKAMRYFSQPGEPPENVFQHALSTPGLGYTREWQEEIQRWHQLWLDHNEAVRHYTQVLGGIASRATERLGKKLFDLATEGKTPETLRAFYDIWVDCGEESYADAAMQPEFINAQARLVNTLMAVKRQEQKMIDEWLSSLNMPTRRELDTNHRRIHELRRDVWQLRDILDEGGIRELREEVASLQREVASLHVSEESGEKRIGNKNKSPSKSSSSI